MSHVASIGLDVHARSIKGCAFNPFTGEVDRKSFPHGPASVAGWILSFESPRAVYESGVTGFHLCRELRCLGVDCVIGAVSKMQKPAADKRRKTDKRDAEFLVKQLALHEIVEVHAPDRECEGAGAPPTPGRTSPPPSSASLSTCSGTGAAAPAGTAREGGSERVLVSMYFSPFGAAVRF